MYVWVRNWPRFKLTRLPFSNRDAGIEPESLFPTALHYEYDIWYMIWYAIFMKIHVSKHLSFQKWSSPHSHKDNTCRSLMSSSSSSNMWFFLKILGLNFLIKGIKLKGFMNIWQLLWTSLVTFAGLSRNCAVGPVRSLFPITNTVYKNEIN